MTIVPALRRGLGAACTMLAATTVAAIPAFATTTATTTPGPPCFDVDQYLGDAGHSGSGMPTTGIDGTPAVLWTAPSASPVTGAPAIVSGVAYLADGFFGDGALRAIDTATGTDLWTTRLPGQPFGSTPAVVDGVAYVVDGSGNVTAVDVTTHQQRWTVPLAESISSSPAVADGIVVVNAGDTVFALDPTSGATRWTFANGGDGGYTVESSAAIVDGVVFATSIASDGDESMWALNAATGEELWSFEPDEAGLTTPVYHEGVLYAGGSGGLVAVDAATGDALWTSAIGHVFSAPAVSSDLVVVHTIRDLVAVDAATGEEVWRADTGGSWSSPTLVDGVVYVGSNGRALRQSVQLLHASTGELITRVEGFGAANSPVVVTGGAAFATTDDGMIAIGVPGTSTCAAPPV